MMKRILLTTSLFAIFFTSLGQISFSVSPGLSLNSANVGYQFSPNIVGFFGFQHFNGSLNYEWSGEEWDFDRGNIVDDNYTDEIKGGILMPTLGLKYLFNQTNALRPYLQLSISKPFITASASYDGESDDELEDIVDGLSLWGGELGFGVEYFFSESFSLGGEFGLRYFRINATQTYDRRVYNPDDNVYIDSETTESYNIGFSPTFSRVSLSFYFNK